MERNYSLDTLKFVFLHANLIGKEYILPITRCAVPCFFIISGYLIYSKDSYIFKKRLTKGIKKMSIILIWSTCLYIPIKLLIAYKMQDYSFLSYNALIKFVCFNENPFGFHLWYISAYLYVLIIYFITYRNKLIKFLIFTTPILLIIDLLFGKYSLLIWQKEYPYILLRNFIFVGIPYFSIGLLIKHFKPYFLKNKYILIFSLGVFLFSLSSILEYIILNHLSLNATRDHYFSSTFLAIFLFLFFLQKKQNKKNILSIIGEKYSLYIYIFHPLFLIAFPVIIKHIPIEHLNNIYQDTSAILVLLSTILFIYILKTFKIIK